MMTAFEDKCLKNEGGFTLIEILTVIVIIGILSVIAIPQYSFYKVRAYDSISKSDIYGVYSSCRAYWADNPKEPCSLSDAFSPIYGFIKSDGVVLTIENETKGSFKATSSHLQGTNIYEIGPDGYATLQ
jgi:type IV pilus assembly protein PilA